MREVNRLHHFHHREQKDHMNPSNISPKKVVGCRMKLEIVVNNCADTTTTLNMEVVKSLHILVVTEIQITLKHPKIVRDIVRTFKVGSSYNFKVYLFNSLQKM